MTSRGTVCGIAVGSVVAGLVLGRYTIIRDMLQRVTLASRVEVLTQSRAEAVDAAAAELRRLERDLHDGAQARLVAIGLSLRALEKMIPLNPGAATALAVECRESSALAWPNCATSSAASTRRCSPSGASVTPSARSPSTARSTSPPRSTCPAARRRRWRRPPTSRSPRR